jgi:hypothetical protein
MGRPRQGRWISLEESVFEQKRNAAPPGRRGWFRGVVAKPRHPSGTQELHSMIDNQIIVVYLRPPDPTDKRETRPDPFYEFGSFGCTGCKSTKLMNPKKTNELEGHRLAFAQGSKRHGTRLIQLTPPCRVTRYRDLCELEWEPEPYFRYDSAPLLVAPGSTMVDGRSDFPTLLAHLSSPRWKGRTWPLRFMSAFRSTRSPLPDTVADEMIRVYQSRRANASPDAFARSYLDTLPYPPNIPDTKRNATLASLRAKAASASKVAPPECGDSAAEETASCSQRRGCE